MKKPSRLDILILIVILIPAIIGAFFIGRNTNKVEAPIEKPDVRKYEITIDSLYKVKALSDSALAKAHKQIDSLKSVKSINHKQLHNDLHKIKLFTPDRRNRWNDSVLKLEGIRPSNVGSGRI